MPEAQTGGSGGIAGCAGKKVGGYLQDGHTTVFLPGTDKTDDAHDSGRAAAATTAARWDWCQEGGRGLVGVLRYAGASRRCGRRRAQSV